MANTRKAIRIVGEVLSQLLNVPILSAALLTFLLFKLPDDVPNRIGAYALALVFMSLIPLGSLLFYIPGKLRDWPRILRRQRIASFVFMLISYPIGFVVLRLTGAPKIYEALAATYALVTLGLVIVNVALRYKASGHAAGVAGPVAALIYFYGLIVTPLLLLLPLTTFARVSAKGHTVVQTVVGALLSLGITALLLWAYGFEPLSGLLGA